MNDSISGVTGYSPRYLQFGEKRPHPIEKYVSFPPVEKLNVDKEQLLVSVRERVSKSAKKRIDRFNSGIIPVAFQPGDKVLMRTHRQSSALDKTIKKFFLLYEGPFKVLRCGPNSYILQDSDGREVGKCNVINLKKYKERIVNPK